MGIYPKELKTGTQTDICIPMFVAAVIINNSQNVGEVSIDKWINKMQYIHRNRI